MMFVSLIISGCNQKNENYIIPFSNDGEFYQGFDTLDDTIDLNKIAEEKCVVMVDGLVVENEDVLLNFLEDTEEFDEQSIRVYQFKDLNDELKTKMIIDLFKINDNYYVFNSLATTHPLKPYPYMKVFDHPDSYGYGLFRKVILSMDYEFSFEQFEYIMTRSQQTPEESGIAFGLFYTLEPNQ
jgi:hypothetical protein